MNQLFEHTLPSDQWTPLKPSKTHTVATQAGKDDSICAANAATLKSMST